MTSVPGLPPLGENDVMLGGSCASLRPLHALKTTANRTPHRLGLETIGTERVPFADPSEEVPQVCLRGQRRALVSDATVRNDIHAGIRNIEIPSCPS